MLGNLMIKCGLFEEILSENCFRRDFNLYYRFFDEEEEEKREELLTNWVRQRMRRIVKRISYMNGRKVKDIFFYFHLSVAQIIRI